MTRTPQGTPVKEALQGAVTAIAAAGCETPRLDAELLLAHVLGVSRERLLVDSDRLTVAGQAVRDYQQAVRRRAIEREPVAYILGRRAFRDLDLHSDRRALVPRPETELLVEWAVRELPPRASVLDLCTGSGAVALALRHERPDLTVAGSDISEDALGLAAQNARELNLLPMELLRADLLDDVPDVYDAVLANPPYVAERDRATLAPEILRHEPARALFAGPDGMAVIERIARQLTERPRTARAAIEVGDGQADLTAELLAAAGFPDTSFELDLAGIKRVVVGQRKGDGDGSR